MSDLKKLRSKLSEIDLKIIDLIHQRQSLSQDIGILKRTKGKPTRDYKREKEVIELAKEHASKLNIESEMIVDLMQLLIKSSLKTQEKARVKEEGLGSGQKVLVIGGCGRMGNWFVEFLTSQGYTVEIADPSQERSSDNSFQNWKDADDNGERYLPHEFMYKMLLSGVLEEYYEIDLKDSWMYAAAEKNLPIIVPGWEDSTMGNIFASYVLKGELKASTMKSGIEYMTFLADWYTDNSKSGIGFFQIGGGIAGDFPICVVPMLYQDMERTDTPFWSYFCQISDSTTSYGSYSGAVPNEKITWGKLDINTPKFIIESDATIVAPLIFAYLLDM